ncbi:hypothetical protein ACMGDH_00235 [Sphingomonas sp. DT-207]|uniref:hypothetical protein n=1 Tax=Sphingomonas sp. DT-207 TaxID=3396167 RepID=UPI003F19A38F
MRILLVLIGLVLLAVVVLMSLGMISIRQQQGATLPSVRVDGGQLPKFKAETGSVGIGTENETVQVPVVEMTNKTVSVPTIEVRQAGASPTPAAR